MQLGVARLRVAFDEILQETKRVLCRICGLLAGTDLRLKQGGLLPIRAQLEGALHFGERPLVDARRTRRHGDRVVRFRHAKERSGNFLQQNENAEPVLLPGKHPVQAEQVFTECILVAFQHADE